MLRSILLRHSLFHICAHVNIDLTLYTKKKKKKTLCFKTKWIFASLSLFIVLFIIRINPNIGNAIDLSLKFGKIISRVFCSTLLLYIFCISITPATCTLCLIIFQICRRGAVVKSVEHISTNL